MGANTLVIIYILFIVGGIFVVMYTLLQYIKFLNKFLNYIKEKRPEIWKEIGRSKSASNPNYMPHYFIFTLKNLNKLPLVFSFLLHPKLVKQEAIKDKELSNFILEGRRLNKKLLGFALVVAIITIAVTLANNWKTILQQFK